MMENTVCSLGRRLLLPLLLPLLFVCGICTTAQAQITYLANESFRKALPQGWSAYPASTPTAPTWAPDTHVTASGKYAMHGYVPYNAGDTVELVTPFYDCSNYKHVQLRFKHICKVFGSDLCQVYYRENYVGSKWQPIPADAYKGECKYYKANLSFDHASYAEWMAADTFAVPTAGWYHEEVFDMSDYAGYSTVAFKFVIRKGTYFGSFIADGWHLDDFELLASNHDMKLPEVSFTQSFTGTVYQTGPFLIRAKVAARSIAPIVRPHLHYMVYLDGKVTGADSVLMNDINGGDSLWEASIPQFVYGSTISYWINGRDTMVRAIRKGGSFYLKNPYTSSDTNSVAMYSIDNPKAGTLAGRQAVSVTIRNKGVGNLTSAKLGWSVNGVLQSPKNWTGNLPCDLNDTLTLGYYTQKLGGYDTVVCWVNTPNNKYDSISNDDTLTVIAYGCDSLLRGTYTVGAGASCDFQDMEEAMFSLTHCGIGGNVELKLASGVYRTALDFTNYGDFTGIYRLTVSSMAGAADSVVFCPVSGNVVTLANCKNLFFKNLTFSADSAVAYVIHFGNGITCENVEFSHCHLKGAKITSNNYAQAVVYTSGCILDNVRFIGNHIEGGSYGIFIHSNGTPHKVTFDSNHISSSYYLPLHFNRTEVVFTHNTLMEAPGHNNSFNTEFYYCQNSLFEGNHIQTNGHSKTQNPFCFYYPDSTTLICNNEIVCQNDNGTTYALSVYYSGGTRVVNNSVYVLGNASTHYGMYVYSFSSAYSGYIHNNNVVIDPNCTGTDYPVYMTSPNNMSVWDIDYNNWYSKSCMGYVGGVRESLAEFLSIVPTALHESNVMPRFRDTADLHLLSLAGLKCPRYAGVTADLEGAYRAVITGRGCYTIEPDTSDAALMALLGWPKGYTFAGDTLYPKVVVENCGMQTITSATIGWQVNGVSHPSVYWKGNLQTGGRDTIALGTYICAAGKNNISTFISSIGPSADQSTANDTLNAFNNTCRAAYKGHYTVGDTGDFATLDMAVSSLKKCGIGGPVELLVSDGQYVGISIDGKIPGADSVNTVTIRSATGNSDSVIIKGVTAVSLRRVGHLLFEDISIEGTLTGVALEDTITDVTFHRCKISAPSGTANSSATAIDFSGKLKGCLRFVSNTVEGGYYGINASHGNPNDISRNIGMVIDSNSIINSVQGIYINMYTPVLSISHNRIVSSFLGIASSNHSDIIAIEGNRIDVTNVSTAMGINCGVFQNQNIDPLQITNNLINVTGNPATGIIFNATGSSKMDAHHNSIFVTSPNAEAMGINVGFQFAGFGINSNNRITRNLIVAQGNPSYPLKILTRGPLRPQPFVMVNVGHNYTKRSWNNLYSTTNVAYIDNALTSIAALQALTQQDSFSISAVESSGPFSCPAIATVDKDINGIPRTSVTYIGCHHLEPDSNDVAIDALTGVDNVNGTSASPVGAVIRNAGWKEITDTVTVRFFVDGVQQRVVRHLPAKPLAFNKSDTVALGSYLLPEGTHHFLASVSMPNDSNAKNDTLRYSRYVCVRPMRGMFVIGGSSKADCRYDSIGVFFDRMNSCGVDGDITLAFESGRYAGTMDFEEISAVMKGHRLTVTSMAHDRDSVLIAGNGPLLKIGSFNSNITVSDLTLQSSNGTNVINMSSGGHDIRILRNNLMADTNVNTASCIYGILNGTSYFDGVRIAGNRFYGGTYGVCMPGSSAISSSSHYNVIIDSNDLKKQFYGAIRVQYHNIASISHNQIWGQNTSGVTWSGIEAIYVDFDSIVGNSIRNADSVAGMCSGIVLNYCCRNGNPGLVANNAIKLNTSQYAVSLGYSSAINFYHNTVYVDGSCSGSCFFMNGNPSIYIKGNQFVAKGGTSAFLANTAQYNADYNNYHTGTPIWGYVNNLGFSSIAQLQAMTNGNEMHSVSVAPVFTDLSHNLNLVSNSAFFMQPLVPMDITGRKRLVITNMGAYQAQGEKTDAALTDFAGTALTGGNSSPVYATLVNNGQDTLKSATVHWIFNGVAQSSVNWSGSLSYGESKVIALGNCTGTSNRMNRIVAFVTSPNGNADSEHGNDTIRYNEYLCNGRMAGNYTIGGNSPDFASVEEAVGALRSCGLNGPVVMKIRSGNYGMWSFTDSIGGTSVTNTVSFVADSAAIPVFQQGAVFNNIAHIRFHGLTFGSTAADLSGVRMTGSCRDVVFRGCNIYSNVTGTNSQTHAFSYDNSSNTGAFPADVRLIANHIAGGYYNIHLNYMVGDRGNMSSSSMNIDSNVLEDGYYGGVYVNYYSSIRSLSHNRITSRYAQEINNSNSYCGVYSYYWSNYGSIEGNRIYVKCTGSGYGMYFYYDQNRSGYSNSAALVANNEIRIYGGNANPCYGMYLYGQYSRMNVLHNSIYVKADTGAEATGIWLRSHNATHFTNLYGNMLVTECKTGSYPLYIGNNNGSGREYNNLYSVSDSCVAYLNNRLTTVSALQAASGTDNNTINVKPVFVHLEDGLEMADYDAYSCPLDTLVRTDLYGIFRGVVTSMGCYGMKMWDGVNLRADSIVSPVPIRNVHCFEDSVQVEVSVINRGRYVARFDSSSLKISLDVGGVVNLHHDTVFSSGSLLPGQVMNVPLTAIPVRVSGKYNIQVTLSCQGDVLAEDDTISMVYNASRVEPPYDENFSAVPAELLNVRNTGTVDWQVVRDSAIPSAFGTGRLEFAGAGNPGASASAVFNAVDIRGCVNPTLSFWYAHGVNSGTRDILYVFATTDGGASYTTIGRITPTDTVPGWKQYDIDLSRFVNEPCLSIVFQAISFGGADQSIDRIRISADADAALTLLPVDFTAFTACENDAVPLKVVVSNITAMPVEYSSDTIRATVTGASNQGFTCVYSKSLVGYESDTITLGGIDLRANGNYYINVSMQSQDDNAQNDTASDSTLYIWQDLAIDSIIGIDAQTQHPGGDTVWVSALVRNRSNLEADRFTLRMSLNGALVVEDTVYAPLSAGDTMTHAMSLPYVVPFADKEQPYYFLELSVTLPCDGDSANDLRSVVGAVHVPDTVDLQLLSIARPADTLGRKKVSPVVRLANIGNADVQDVMLHVEVLDSAMGLLDNISETVNFIRSNDTAEHVFALTYAVPDYDGRYWLRAYVERHADELEPGNDTLMAQFSCKRNNIGIARHDGEGWNLGQNEPNPASSVTAIPFNVPLDGRVVLSVMGVNGQLLHREEIDATAGANRVELQLETLPAGLYYYSLEYRGQRQVRKMTVIK